MAERRLLARWTVANAIGMSLGFLTFGFDFKSHWSEAAVERLENAGHLLRINLVIGLPLAGAVVGSCQAWALRGRVSRLGQWIHRRDLADGWTRVAACRTESTPTPQPRALAVGVYPTRTLANRKTGEEDVTTCMRRFRGRWVKRHGGRESPKRSDAMC